MFQVCYDIYITHDIYPVLLSGKDSISFCLSDKYTKRIYIGTIKQGEKFIKALLKRINSICVLKNLELFYHV